MTWTIVAVGPFASGALYAAVASLGPMPGLAAVPGWLAWLTALPGWLATLVLAFNPVGEVRTAAPVGMLHYGMGWAEAFTWCLLGNLLVLPVAWWLYPRIERVLRRWPRADRWLDRLYERTRQRSSRRVERFEETAITFLIAIPLPGSGAWTGVLLAHVFGLPWKKVAPAFYVGVVAATALAVFLVETGRRAFPFFYA